MSAENYGHLQYCACFNMRKASRMVTQLFDHALQPVGIKCTQFTILGVLANSEEITINELSAKLGMDRTTVTRSLERLERDKLISSREGDDARQRKVQLLESGYALLDVAIPYWEKAQSVMQNGFEDKFQELLLTLGKCVDTAVQEI